MTQPINGYRAYLLRLCGSPEAGWRASLEDPHSGERSAFATLAELVAHLERASERRAPDSQAPGTVDGDCHEIV